MFKIILEGASGNLLTICVLFNDITCYTECFGRNFVEKKL